MWHDHMLQQISLDSPTRTGHPTATTQPSTPVTLPRLSISRTSRAQRAPGLNAGTQEPAPPTGPLRKRRHPTTPHGYPTPDHTTPSACSDHGLPPPPPVNRTDPCHCSETQRGTPDPHHPPSPRHSSTTSHIHALQLTQRLAVHHIYSLHAGASSCPLRRLLGTTNHTSHDPTPGAIWHYLGLYSPRTHQLDTPQLHVVHHHQNRPFMALPHLGPTSSPGNHPP